MTRTIDAVPASRSPPSETSSKKRRSHWAPSTWTVKDATNALKLIGINDSWSTKMTNVMVDNHVWLHAVLKEDWSTEECAKHGDEYINDLKKTGIRSVPKPVNWHRDLPIGLNIEVPMHIVALGIGESTCRLTQLYLGSKQMNSTFVETSKGVLESVAKLSLSWCKSRPYGEGKQGGWVSENWLAWIRLAPWFYSYFCELEFAPVREYREPEKDQSSWTRAENNAWLKARGLTFKGNAKEMAKEVIEKYFEMA